jgi:hypothetical protein
MLVFLLLTKILEKPKIMPHPVTYFVSGSIGGEARDEFGQYLDNLTLADKCFALSILSSWLPDLVTWGEKLRNYQNDEFYKEFCVHRTNLKNFLFLMEGASCDQVTQVIDALAHYVCDSNSRP